jgi:hypothetical protein
VHPAEEVAGQRDDLVEVRLVGPVPGVEQVQPGVEQVAQVAVRRCARSAAPTGEERGDSDGDDGAGGDLDLVVDGLIHLRPSAGGVVVETAKPDVVVELAVDAAVDPAWGRSVWHHPHRCW